MRECGCKRYKNVKDASIQEHESEDMRVFRGRKAQRAQVHEKARAYFIYKGVRGA